MAFFKTSDASKLFFSHCNYNTPVLMQHLYIAANGKTDLVEPLAAKPDLGVTYHPVIK
jgi:hypothetical protein